MTSIAAVMSGWGSLQCDGKEFTQGGHLERILTDEICILAEKYYDEHDGLECDETSIYDAANWADNIMQENNKHRPSTRDSDDEYLAMVLPFSEGGLIK